MAKASPQHVRPSVGVQHKGTSRHIPKERRENARGRGYTARWERFRKSFLSQNPLCAYCLGKGLTVPAKVCDHDLPHEGDPDLFWDNTFTPLCAHCHSSSKQRLERRYKGQDLLDAIKRMKAGA